MATPTTTLSPTKPHQQDQREGKEKEENEEETTKDLSLALKSIEMCLAQAKAVELLLENEKATKNFEEAIPLFKKSSWIVLITVISMGKCTQNMANF